MKKFRTLLKSEAHVSLLVKVAHESFWSESGQAKFVNLLGEITFISEYDVATVWFPTLREYSLWSVCYLAKYNETQEEI